LRLGTWDRPLEPASARPTMPRPWPWARRTTSMSLRPRATRPAGSVSALGRRLAVSDLFTGDRPAL